MSCNALSDDVLGKAAALEVFDASGSPIKFGSIYEEQKTVVVFVRHFHCGRCQDYCTALSSVREDALSEAGTKIVIIGCGQPQLIPKYREATGFTGPIYADPSLGLFKLLELGSSLRGARSGERKGEYITDTFLQATFKSAWKGPLKNPRDIGKQGPYSQLGGEFVLGPGQKCSFAWRMKNTEDHTDVPDLMREAGVAYP